VLYVMVMKWQPGLNREQRDGALIRRAQWKYPDAATVLGEYWPASEQVAVISILETNDYGAIMEIHLTWGDVFQIDTTPAISAEDGLRVGAEAMGRRSV
jgi:hypothetical protein